MQLRPQIQIQTIIKAMMEDVIPALDQTNQLAMQSAQLTIGTLTMIAQHLPLEYRYDCDELARLIDAAAKLREQAQGGTQTEQAGLALRAALEGDETGMLHLSLCPGWRDDPVPRDPRHERRHHGAAARRAEGRAGQSAAL